MILKHMLVLALFLFLCACGGNTGTQDNTATDKQDEISFQNAGAQEQEVYQSVNDERAADGETALDWSVGLYNLAKGHANDMCDRTYFSHTNPEGEGPWERAQEGHAGNYTFDPMVPNPFIALGENIAMGQPTVQDVMDSWMNSSGHRANILDPDFTDIGVAYVVCTATHGPIWAQCFGQR